jgi:hypothetical protein
MKFDFPRFSLKDLLRKSAPVNARAERFAAVRHLDANAHAKRKVQAINKQELHQILRKGTTCNN